MVKLRKENRTKISDEALFSMMIGKEFGNDCAELCEYMFSNGYPIEDTMDYLEIACCHDNEYYEYKHMWDDFYRGFLFGQIVGIIDADLFSLANKMFDEDDGSEYGYFFQEVCY